MKSIFVVAEHDNDKLLPITHELISCARSLSKSTREPVTVVIPGSSHPAMAREIASLGIQVIDLAIPGIDGYNSGAYKACLDQLFAPLGPMYIIVAHTAIGRDFAPGLGVRLNGCSIAGVNNLVWGKGGPLFSRSILNGTQNALVRPTALPCIVMVQPGAFPAQKSDASSPGKVISMEIPFMDEKIESLGVKTTNTNGDDFERASVIVAAGRGLGKRENLGAIGEFASLFPNAMVGASRPLVDEGWIKYPCQVGITGARVSPKVYIACGISGSSQHLAGIMGSEMIVSINSDPNAAIFNHSDLCIVEDILAFISIFERIVNHEREQTQESS